MIFVVSSSQQRWVQLYWSFWRSRPSAVVLGADQKVYGRLHYHSAKACPEDITSPHCLEPSLPLSD